MVLYIVSKDEVPTPNGAWDMKWQGFKFKNTVSCPKISHVNQKIIEIPMGNCNTHYIKKSQVFTRKWGWDMEWQSFKFENAILKNIKPTV